MSVFPRFIDSNSKSKILQTYFYFYFYAPEAQTQVEMGEVRATHTPLHLGALACQF